MQILNFNYSTHKSPLSRPGKSNGTPIITAINRQPDCDSYTSHNKTISFGAKNIVSSPSSQTIKFRKLLTPYTLDIDKQDGYTELRLKNDKTGEFLKITGFEPASDWRSCNIEYGNRAKSKYAVFHSDGYYDGIRSTKNSLTCDHNNMSVEEFITKIDNAFEIIKKFDSAPNSRCISDAYKELKKQFH